MMNVRIDMGVELILRRAETIACAFSIGFILGSCIQRILLSQCRGLGEASGSPWLKLGRGILVLHPHLHEIPNSQILHRSAIGIKKESWKLDPSFCTICLGIC